MKTKTVGFRVIDQETGDVLVTLPLTFPIGASVENFEKAGYTVSWEWAHEVDCSVGG